MQRRWTTGPIVGDLGIAARRARGVFANGQSEDDDPRGGDRHAMGAVDALDCGEGGDRRHDEDNDDAQTNVGVVPNGGGGVGNDCDRAFFHRRRRRDGNGRTRRRRR